MKVDPVQHGFELRSDGLIVMDPGHPPGCGVTIENCVPGVWNASVRLTPAGDKDVLLANCDFPTTGLQRECIETGIIGSTCFHAIYDRGVVEEQEKSGGDAFERIMKRVSEGGEALSAYESIAKPIASIDAGLVFLWDGDADCSIYKQVESDRVIAVEIHGHSLH